MSMWNVFMTICLCQRHLWQYVSVKGIYDYVKHIYNICLGDKYLWQYVYVKDSYDNMSISKIFMTIFLCEWYLCEWIYANMPMSKIFMSICLCEKYLW